MLASNHLPRDEATAFVSLLKHCSKRRDLYRGTRLHDEIVQRGLLDKCSDTLITMYAKCGALGKAKELFDMHQSRDVFTWTALISGHVQKGQGEEALIYFKRMQEEGLSPDAWTFSSILKACSVMGAIDIGEKIYEQLAKQELLGKNIVLDTALVDMYAKCGALETARKLLEEHQLSNGIPCWNAIIAVYTQRGDAEKALDCYEQILREGLSPNAVTFICILKACGTIRVAEKRAKIHDDIAKSRLLGSNIVLGSALVDMYAKCADLKKARAVFEQLSGRTVICWNVLITGYVQEGEGVEALNCYEQMQQEGIFPDTVTYICILKACSILKALDKGAKIHDEIAKQGLLASEILLRSALVDMYVKCEAFSKARQVLEDLPSRNVSSWNAIIAGYAQQGQGAQALDCFEQMQREGLFPDVVTFTCILKACASIRAANKGRRIHGEIFKQGLLGKNLLVGTALVDMYAKCGALAKARQVLEELPVRDVFCWSALIGGLTEQGDAARALNCYEQMQREGISPNVVTLLYTLKACGNIGAADQGGDIHQAIAKQGLWQNDVQLGTALIDMYAKCGALRKARRVLEELPVRNVISWNALISGYAQEGEGEEALECLEVMRQECLDPDAVTYTCILKACCSIGAADKGGQIHEEIAKKGLLGRHVVLGTALVDMYAKCGAVAMARQVLDKLPLRLANSWNALVLGYAQLGEGMEALNCLEQMRLEGLSPDAATLSCMLSACSRGGFAEDALWLLLKVSTRYHMEPELEHFNSIVDLFGREGHLDKALSMLEKMPCFSTEMWSALLGACRKWGDMDVGRWAFDHGVQLDRNDSAFYIFMASIYAANHGMQEYTQNIEATSI